MRHNVAGLHEVEDLGKAWHIGDTAPSDNRNSASGRSEATQSNPPDVDGCMVDAMTSLTSDAGAGSLPRIFVNNRQLRDVSDDALAALQLSNLDPSLFVRGGMLVAVINNEKNRQVISVVGEPHLRGRLSRSANYFRVNANGHNVEVPPPLEVVRDILALPPARWEFQALDAIVEAPVLRPDGSILDVPGYDRGTQLYYSPDPTLKVPVIAEQPTADHIKAALDLIDQAIGEFPYVDEASKANAIAALLSPIVKHAIDSPSPMALMVAPQAGTGKSLLAEVVSIVATGRAGEMFSAPQDGEEWRKQITTALLSATPVVVIDNINRRLDNSDLCKVLTETLHADRTFRTHEKMVLPVKSTWIGTGNNIQLGGDMPRRCYWIRLDAKTSRPFMRTGFKIENLKEWVTNRRGDLLAALLTLARAWYASGRPKPSITPLGSYEAWSITVGGIIQHAGVTGFLANAEELYAEADSESVQWEGFLQTLAEVFYGEPFVVAQIVEKMKAKTWNGNDAELTDHAAALRAALPDFLAEGIDRDGFFQRRTGKAFAERVNRRFGKSGVHLIRGGVLHKVQQWAVKSGGLDV